MTEKLSVLQNMNEEKIYYRRHLPHYQPPEATMFVTFRLSGSLPREVIEQLRFEKEMLDKEIKQQTDVNQRERLLKEHRILYFEKFDNLLDNNNHGPLWLRDERAAAIVKEAIHYRDGKVYDLLAYCIMPNHVHMVFVGRNVIPTYRILQSLKRHTALRVNKILQRRGAFWQDESYDHVVRDGKELDRIIWYILNNPVKAGFVESWEQWQWSYCKIAVS